MWGGCHFITLYYMGGGLACAPSHYPIFSMGDSLSNVHNGWPTHQFMYESSIFLWSVWMETNIKSFIIFFTCFVCFFFFGGGVCQIITPYYGGGGLKNLKKLLCNIWMAPNEKSKLNNHRHSSDLRREGHLHSVRGNNNKKNNKKETVHLLTVGLVTG